MRKIAAVTLVCMPLLLSGCFAAPPVAESPSPSRSPMTVTVPAAYLIGAWEITESGTDYDGIPMFVSSSDVTFSPDCGWVALYLGAGPTSIIIERPYMFSNGCAGSDHPDREFASELAWLTRATAYELDDDGWRLTDASGHAVATLIPFELAGSKWEKDWPESRFDRQPDSFVFPLLGEALEPVTLEGLQGTWVREGTSEPGLTIDGDHWRNNGCHGGGTTIRVDEGGFIVTTGFVMTANGCSPADTLLNSGFAGFDDEVLVVGDERLVNVSVP